MSTTDGRRDRIKRILDLLYRSRRPLTSNEIAAKTSVLEEITKERLYIYLENLEWSGQLIRHGNTYMAIPKALSKTRERERKKQRERQKTRNKAKMG
jgi:hypothetical protein